MQADAEVLELLERVRQRDEVATAEFVRQFEPVIRRWVRVWMRMQDARLQRVLDSADVCQSVMASFLRRAEAGHFEFSHPGELVALLRRMSRRKWGHQVRHAQAERRDVRRVAEMSAHDVAATGTAPSQIVANRELWAELCRRLSREERELADARADRREWTDIAAQFGGTAEARRKQLARAVERVLAELDPPSDG